MLSSPMLKAKLQPGSRNDSQAGPQQCAAHGPRKAAAGRRAELGASVHEIAAVTGNRSLKDVQRYTKGAEQKRLAEKRIGSPVRRTNRA